MKAFKASNRNQPFLLPPSIQDWLPKEHLARFIVEIVEQLDLSKIESQYSGKGKDAYHPQVMLCLLFYGYATGVFSSRKIERATYDSVAFRYIAANTHPDHDTIATFRKRFLKELSELFVQILSIAQEMGVLKVGKVSLDGTKVKANASKHKALSYAHATKLQKQLEDEVAILLKKAQSADNKEDNDGMNIPEEIARRENKLEVIKAAKLKIEQRAKERHKQEIVPTLQWFKDNPTLMPDSILADAGYYSDENVRVCEAEKITPYISFGKEQHNQPLEDRFTQPEVLPEDATDIEKMKHRLQTKEGKEIYALRKSMIEPLFGVMKHVMGFRQFILRGFEKAQGEWTLMCIAYNLKRLHTIRA